MVQISDPDYLERFVDEFATQISDMSASEFANTLKASTEATLDFVKLETYLTDQDTRNRMHEPLIKDNNVLGYEYEEVKRLAEQFLPNEDIYISIDKYGEIFYRVADGIIKGTTNDGRREVRFIQVPSRYISNEKTDVPEEPSQEPQKIDNVQDESMNVKDPINKEVGNMEVQVTFDQNRFRDLFEVRKVIMDGDDPDLQNEFINQMNALFDLCYVQEVSPALIQCINIFYNENKSEFENVKRSGTMINGKEMNLQEYNLLSKMDEAYRTSLKGVEEEVQEEIDEFGIEGTTKEETKDKPKARTLQKPKANKNHGISTITIILEILTVAIIIMMFLSLDI